MFQVRKVRKEDLPAISLIEASSYPEPWSMKAFETEFLKNADNKNIFLVAYDGAEDKIAGYVMGDRISGFIGILNLAVSSEYRNKGIALELMKALEREAFQAGFMHLTLEVREDNAPAVRLYKKLGYAVKGKREKYYENKIAALLMWKTL